MYSFKIISNFKAELFPMYNYVLPNIYLTHFIVSEICAINLLMGDRILLFAIEWLVTLYYTIKYFYPHIIRQHFKLHCSEIIIITNNCGRSKRSHLMRNYDNKMIPTSQIAQINEFWTALLWYIKKEGYAHL